MRIVYVSPHYHPVIGGAEIHVQALAEHLVARGHEVSVFTLRTSDPVSTSLDATLPQQEHIRGVNVFRVPPDERLRAHLNRVLEWRGSWRLSRALFGPGLTQMLADGPLLPRHAWRILRARPDLITTVNWCFPAFTQPLFLARRFMRAPLVGMPLLHTEIAWARSPVIAGMIARSDAILANTEHEARFCEARGLPADRAYVCGAGVDPATLSRPEGKRLRELHGLGDGPVVAYVGRMQEDKGVPLLVEAMRLVWASHPRARLLLAGRRPRDGTRDDHAFRAALAALEPEERKRVVHIDGFAPEDKASIFDACDVFAMSSITDSFGQTYLEAWLCGRPVVGARIPAMECVIDHGIDGLLVPPRNAAGLADALLKLISDGGRRDAMAAAGRQKTLAHFTWDRVTDRVEAAYRGIVAACRRSP